MGIPATGKPINVVGTAIVWIENGRVTRLQELFDLQTLMQQISTTPSKRHGRAAAAALPGFITLP